MKKRYIAIILILVVLGLSLLLLIKSCNAEKDEVLETADSYESTLAVVREDETSTTSESETTKEQETKKVDEVITTSTFVSLTAPKSGLVDKGDYYELSVSVNEKDSSGNIYTSSTDTIKISKNATVTWYQDSSTTNKLSLSDYLTKTDYLRMYYTDFNGNVIYSKDSNGYVVSFFDGQFS